MAAEIVLELGLPLPEGWLYFVDEEGYVLKVQKGQREKVTEKKIAREPGFNYFVDKDGHVAKKPWGK